MHVACQLIIRVRIPLSLVAAIVILLAFKPAYAEEVSGAAIYANLCVSCHGPNGEGTKENPSPLVGDRSLQELADLIERTMPEDEPEKCVGEDAQRVAAYIHETFYSAVARERNRPASIEFSRLTVRQHENALADLLTCFTGLAPWGGGGGISAEYRRRAGKQNPQDFHLTRVEKTIDFDFGKGLPTVFPATASEEKKKAESSESEEEKQKKEKEEPPPFTIDFRGSLLAPETGDYEFILRTENGAQLWVNSDDEMLIDGLVRSGDQTEYRRSVRLLGGRAYPLLLKLFREKGPTASIRLSWKRPHHVEEIIPAEYLSTAEIPATFVTTTKFPPDDRSTGYERASTISKSWDEAVTAAALETARFVAAHQDKFAGVNPGASSDEADRLRRRFAKRFVRRAFRQPLTDEEREIFVDRQFKEATSPEIAIKRIVLLALKSPQFLYREYGQSEFDDYSIAAFLSFTLWDSPPDQILLNAARAGELSTTEQVDAQVDRMLLDKRCRTKTLEFFHHWLRIDDFPDLVKDSATFPDFSPQLLSDLRVSLDLFLNELLTGSTWDFRELLQSDALYLNGRLGRFYGADLADDAPFQKVPLTAQRRAGVLTHPLLMSDFAYDKRTSPIHRGVFLTRNILGRRLKQPPEAIAPLAPDLHADLSTRERVLLQTSPGACQTCHAMINPLGFSLENFDAVGRYREYEEERPVDARGSYTNRDGQVVEFAGSRELADFLVRSTDVHEAFVERIFQYVVKQPVRAFGKDRISQLTQSFATHEFNIRMLLKEIVMSSLVTVRTDRSPSPLTTD